MADSFRYYELVDWLGNGTVVLLLIAAALLIYREWRTSNRITQQQATASGRLADAITELAQAIRHTAWKPTVENPDTGRNQQT